MPVIFPQAPRFNFTRSRATATRQLDRWGMDAALRRNGRADVMVRCVILEYSPKERQGQPQLIEQLDRKALITAFDQDGNIIDEPFPGKDRLVTFRVDPLTGLSLTPLQDAENLQIVAKPGRIGPSGVVVFWRLQVRR